MLREKINNTLPKSMKLPHELALLFNWLEKNKNHNDEGTDLSFFSQSEETENLLKEYYAENSNRLYIFAASNEMMALWLDNKDKIKIVNLGIGSESSLFYVIGDALDFIRLYSIGYYYFDYFYNREDFFNPQDISPNKELQKWVIETFNTTIPKSASEIIPDVFTNYEILSADPFCMWDRKNNLAWQRMKYTTMVYQEAIKLFPESDVKFLSLDEMSRYTMYIMAEVISWLNKDEVDCSSPEVIEKVKSFDKFCLDIKQPDDYKGCDIFTDYIVSFLEELFTEKLHVLIPHLNDKSEFIKNEKFYKEYCSVSEEMYNRVLKLYDEK